ncbi:unnamed protein product [Soboliphyme baturini]|uniref:F-box domain-containing protein n=1 Tax=Soboliphyme baturini TaxID=241478 RepID=A0A183INH8_9BILA|nr:unnamed protein product [Soboliphyme baturini]
MILVKAKNDLCKCLDGLCSRPWFSSGNAQTMAPIREGQRYCLLCFFLDRIRITLGNGGVAGKIVKNSVAKDPILGRKKERCRLRLGGEMSVVPQLSEARVREHNKQRARRKALQKHRGRRGATRRGEERSACLLRFLPRAAAVAKSEGINGGAVERSFLRIANTALEKALWQSHRSSPWPWSLSRFLPARYVAFDYDDNGKYSMLFCRTDPLDIYFVVDVEGTLWLQLHTTASNTLAFDVHRESTTNEPMTP